ncbi:glycosyltransferase family 2 protein [Kandleria sp.]|uniref:glycosyltransferase family 2 protein n=1 Tax=Kandleria sp. TaxID=2774291 RepID=UPI001B6F3A9D|nr:glycosyltransferase family 2 protein [Kandleria sp.]MBP3275667.1 glycosyltransferase family 2 protein [Kandleria sp.]
MLKNDYCVSIIIPFYNDEQYIGQCINSVLAQTLIDDMEVICVNDGSTDNSLEIIEKAKRRNKNIVLINQNRSGAGIARNQGLAVAKGQYIMFLDSDDYFAKSDSVERAYKAVSEIKLDVCFGNMYRLYKGKLVGRFEHSRRFSSFNYEGLISTRKFAYPFIHFLSIYRREFLISNGLKYPDKKRGQDVVFCAEVLKNTPNILHINYPIYVHRITQSKRKFSYEQALDFVDCWKMVLDNCENQYALLSYAALASIELRLFASFGWYEQVDENNEWYRVDELNRQLEKCGANRLLNKVEWEQRGFPYWFEHFYIFLYRYQRFVQKMWYYCLFGKKPTECKTNKNE